MHQHAEDQRRSPSPGCCAPCRGRRSAERFQRGASSRSASRMEKAELNRPSSKPGAARSPAPGRSRRSTRCPRHRADQHQPCDRPSRQPEERDEAQAHQGKNCILQQHADPDRPRHREHPTKIAKREHHAHAEQHEQHELHERCDGPLQIEFRPGNEQGE